MAGNSFASSIGIISLLDTQGEGDTSLLVGATDEQKAQYFPDGKMSSQILAHYVRVPGRDILFDAGLRDGRVALGLMEKGVKPDDVKIICITHLHPDHFGGLVDAEGRAAFSGAELYVSKVERDYWVNDIKNENVINALKLYDGKIHLFEFGDEIFSGITAIDASGHTPGHTVFDIKADGEELLIVGDIMHFQKIQLPLPDVAVRYDVDPEKAIASRKKILDYAAEKGAPIAGMHITPPGIISVKKTGDGYEEF